MALPASTFLRRCSCSSSSISNRGSSRVARRGAGPPRTLLSLYLHSLPSPTRVPTPHARNCQHRPAAPPIRSRVRTCARALPCRRGGGAPSLRPPIGALTLPTLCSSTNKREAVCPGLAAVRQPSGGKVRANRFPAAAALPSAPSRQEEDSPASGRPSFRLAPSNSLRETCKSRFSNPLSP